MLKVMTLNLNYYVTKHGPWPVRKELVHAAIRAAEPDMIALQAVGKDPAVANGADQAAQLRELLPEYRQVIFQPAMDFEDGSLGGSAILSKIEASGIDHLALTLLPGLDDPHRRVLLHARFDLPAGPLHLFNAHFSWVGEQARLNLEEAIAYTGSFLVAGRQAPALLVGDLNTPAGSELWATFEQAGWSDLWAELCPEETGNTFESDDPSIRIDYAWMNRELRPLARSIEIVADNRHASGARPSDHFGLLLSLDLDLAAFHIPKPILEKAKLIGGTNVQ